MKRKDYQLYKWYPITDETYWVEEYPKEFPNCQTIICCTRPEICESILTRKDAYISWGTMAKYDEWRFMIIEKPTITIQGEITREDLDNLEYFHVNETNS